MCSKNSCYILGAFENEEDATEFVKCKIESMFTHESKEGEGKWMQLALGPSIYRLRT
jgi:hypothetical protein